MCLCVSLRAGGLDYWWLSACSAQRPTHLLCNRSTYRFLVDICKCSFDPFVNTCLSTLLSRWYCMRFAIPPRRLRLGSWRLGARSARFFLFAVIGGRCGVLRDPLVCLGVPGGSLGTPGITWYVLGTLGSSWKVWGGPWEVGDSHRGFGNHWKTLFVYRIFIHLQQIIFRTFLEWIRIAMWKCI